MATTSQPRSLLSIARLNMARSRARPSIWSFVRMDQTCLGRSGGFAPVSFPLFQGTRWGAGIAFTRSCMAILLGSVTEATSMSPGASTTLALYAWRYLQGTCHSEDIVGVEV